MKKDTKRLWILIAFLGIFLVDACHKKEEIPPDSDPGITVVPCFTATSPRSGRIIAGQYIVVYQQHFSTPLPLSSGRILSLSQKVLLRHHIPATTIQSPISGIQSGFICQLSTKQAAILRTDPDIALVEPDRIVSIAACITPVDTATIDWGVRRVGYADGTGKTAWIIDSGIDTDHPDLLVDLVRSRSFMDGQASVEDQNGHGTHVAGIIGAKNNKIGTLGTASGANLVALKVLDELGDGKISTVIKALNYIAENAHRGDVVNMSLVSDTISNVLDREVRGIADKGILFAIAAGNRAHDASSVSPARVNHPNVFTVSAMDESNSWASFSNFGQDVVDVAAPGVSILSTTLNGTYAYMSGTSLATPHVTGLLLLDGRNFAKNGTVKNDPDGVPDPIAHKQ